MKTILAVLLTVSTLLLNPASAQNSAQANPDVINPTLSPEPP
jgi:hypothetical protein